MKVVFRPVAAAEVEDAFAWYERQRRGLGEEVLADLIQTLEVIASNPVRYRVVHRETRMALLRRFPYCVLYRALHDDIVVVGFYHGSRNPRGWRGRS